MKCDKCGTELLEGSVFCSKCGTPLNIAPSVAPPISVETPPVGMPPVGTQPVVTPPMVTPPFGTQAAVRKNSSPVKNILIGFLCAFVFFTIIGLLAEDEEEDDEPHKTKHSETSSSVRKSEDEEEIGQGNGTLTFDDFTECDLDAVFNEFNDNCLKADNKYSGALLKGYATVDDVKSQEYFSNIESGPAVSFKNDNYMWINAAIVGDDVYERAAELSEGDVITVYLEYAGLDAFDYPEFYLYYIE